MSLLQLYLALRARLTIILLVLVVTGLVALSVSLLQKKQYSSGASLLVAGRAVDPVSGTVLPGSFQPGYISTQIDIVNSSRVAQRAVRLLKLDVNSGWLAGWRASDGRSEDFLVWAGGVLHGNLDAKPSRESSVINIAYTSEDPVFAAQVANAFAQAYVDVDLDLKIDPARQYAVWFDQQTQRARADLAKAQRALSTYQQTTGIVAADEKFDAENARLNDLTSQYTQIQGQTVEMQSKRANRDAGTSFEAMQSPLVNSLKSEIAQVDAKLQDRNSNLGPNHPETIRLKAQLASLQGQLNSEIGRISTSFNTGFTVNKQREAQLIDAISVQKAKVLGLNKQRDELNILRGDVELAQKAFESLSTRLSQTRLESQSSQSNVSILSPAVTPLKPSKPRILLNTVAGLGVGGVLGMMIALLLELGNRRVRSTEDMLLAIDVPVLASIGPAARLPGPYRVRRYLAGGFPAISNTGGT